VLRNKKSTEIGIVKKLRTDVKSPPNFELKEQQKRDREVQSILQNQNNYKRLANQYQSDKPQDYRSR
jgi:adenosine deaminase